MTAWTWTRAAPVLQTPAAAAPRRARIADTVLEWLQRGRSRRLLAAMDDRMLHDIGLSRDAARGEADKPFWQA